MIPPDSARAAVPIALEGVCPFCGGIQDHGICETCHRPCGCSFNPENRNDYCDAHQPWKRAARAAESEGPTPESLRGCGDHSCAIRKPNGMATNGGCRCSVYTLRAALVVYRSEVERLRAEVAAAREDTRRLDWMQARVEGTGDTMQFGGVCYWGIEIKRGKNGRPTRIGDGDDLRSAIDVARSPSTPDTPEKP